VPFEAPTAMFANADKVSCKSIVLCHDMAGRVEFLDYRHRASTDFIKKQLTILAQLHGQFWGVKDPSLHALPTFSQGIAGAFASALQLWREASQDSGSLREPQPTTCTASNAAKT
jgi:hypothetical protein